MNDRVFRDYGESGTNPDPIPEGKHRIEHSYGGIICIAEKHPSCNWTDKRTIMSESDYKKNFKKKDRIK